MASTTSNTPNRFIKLPEVKRLTSLSTSEIYRRLEAKAFPLQIRLGAKSVAWIESEIHEWINQQIEQGRVNGGANC